MLVQRDAREWIVTVIFGAVLALLLSLHIADPWQYIHDDNGTWTQGVATARLRTGFAETRGQDFFVRRDDGSLSPYLHNPPLFGNVVAIAYTLTGRSDPLVTRLVPALFHLLGFVGMVMLVGALFPTARPARLAALFVYAVVPMSAYFGKMPFNEPLGLCWVVWALWGTARYRQRHSTRALMVAIGFWLLAGWSSWAATVIAFLTALFLLGDGIVDRRAGRVRGAVILGVVTVVSWALVLLHIAWAAKWQHLGVFDAAGHWGIHSMSLEEIARRIGKAIDFQRIYFANIPFLLFVVWIFLRLRDLRGGLAAVAWERHLLMAGCVACVIWVLTFLRQVTVHAYGQFWLLPFVALAVGDMSAVAWRRLRARSGLRTALAVIAAAGTIAGTVYLLDYRYSGSSDYAIEKSRERAERYYLSP